MGYNHTLKKSTKTRKEIGKRIFPIRAETIIPNTWILLVNEVTG